MCQLPSFSSMPDFCLIRHLRSMARKRFKPNSGHTKLGGWTRCPSQVPHALSHLEFLMYTFLQDFGSLAILHLHFPPLCQDPGFLIGQGIPELLGDLCFLLFPSKRSAAWVSLGEKLEDHITVQLQVKAMSNRALVHRTANTKINIIHDSKGRER